MSGLNGYHLRCVWESIDKPRGASPWKRARMVFIAAACLFVSALIAGALK